MTCGRPVALHNPDLNGDGVVNASDVPLFAVFLDAGWGADFNGDGVTNATDVKFWVPLMGAVVRE